MVQVDNDPISQRWLVATDPEGPILVGELDALVDVDGHPADKVFCIRRQRVVRLDWLSPDGSAPVIIAGIDCGAWSANSSYAKGNEHTITKNDTSSARSFHGTKRLMRALDARLTFMENSVNI